VYFNPYMGNAKQWLSTAETADELGVTPRTVYGFTNSGQLTGYRMGRVFRYRAADVDAFLAAQRIRPGDLDHLLGESGSEPDIG